MIVDRAYSKRGKSAGIDRKRDDLIFHARAGTCWQPYVKNVTVMKNSSYNGYRYEDIWMDK